MTTMLILIGAKPASLRPSILPDLIEAISPHNLAEALRIEGIQLMLRGIFSLF